MYCCECVGVWACGWVWRVGCESVFSTIIADWRRGMLLIADLHAPCERVGVWACEWVGSVRVRV